VNNYTSGVVTISPSDGSQPDAKGPQSPRGVYAHTELEGEVLTEKAKSKAQQRFMGMVYAAKQGKKPMSPEVASAAKGMTKKDAKKYAKTKHKGLPEKVTEEMVDRDTRADQTYREVLKNKLRSLGDKNPMLIVPPEEMETIYKKLSTSDMIKKKKMDDKMCEARALGSAGSDDDNPKGAKVRVSSGRGMTMTPARGLGASKPEGDDKKRAARQAAQAKKDRRAAARDRAEEGEDRLSRLVRSVQNSSYEPKGNPISEEEADRVRDERQMRGGVDGNVDYDRPAKTPAPGSQRKRKRRPSAPSAMDIMRKQITDRYGEGSLM